MRRLALIVAAIVGLSGCGVTAADLPLPGNAVSGATYRLSATFADALNLPIGAPVKLNGVPIGKVRSVTARDFKAHVVLELKESPALHAGTHARLRTTTPLGELYVQVDDSGSGEILTDGARLTSTDTSTAPSIEDSMAAASMLLNGGNLGQLRSIVREANAALDGRQSSARDLLTQLTVTAKAFEASSKDIDRTLAALASVSTTLNERESTINAALRDVPAAAIVLRDNTTRLTDLLAGIKSLGTVSQSVLDQTSDQILTILKQAGPILDQFMSVEDEFGPGLRDLVDFAKLLDRSVPTDYLNVYLHLHGDLDLGLLGSSGGASAGTSDPGPTGKALSDFALGLPDLGLSVPGGTGPDIGLSGLLGNLVGGKR